MRAVLEFDLDDHSDDMALKRCHKSLAMAMVLFELAYNSKKGFYYKLEEKDYKNTEVVDMIFERLHDLLDEHSIIIDELIE